MGSGRLCTSSAPGSAPKHCSINSPTCGPSQRALCEPQRGAGAALGGGGASGWVRGLGCPGREETGGEEGKGRGGGGKGRPRLGGSGAVGGCDPAVLNPRSREIPGCGVCGSGRPVGGSPGVSGHRGIRGDAFRESTEAAVAPSAETSNV